MPYMSSVIVEEVDQGEKTAYLCTISAPSFALLSSFEDEECRTNPAPTALMGQLTAYPSRTA